MEMKHPPESQEPAAKKSNGFEYSRQGWKVMGALWLIVLLVVAVPSVGVSVVNAQMLLDLEMDRAIYGMGFGIFVVMMGILGPLVVKLYQKFGYRKTVIIGCILYFLGSVLMATFVRTDWQFVIVFGLVIGAGVCIAGMLPAQTVVTKWFIVRRAFATSVILSAIEVGGFVSPPALTNLLMLTSNNWRVCWWVIAGLAIIALIIAQIVIDEKRVERYIQENPTNTDQAYKNKKVFKSAEHWSLKEAIRTWPYWFILVYMSIAGVAWVFLMANVVVHLRDIGFDPAVAAISIMLLVISSLIGNFTAGFLGDKIPLTLIAAAGAILIAIGFYLGIKPSGFEEIVLFSVPIGIGYGASQVCLMAILGNYFGKTSFSAMYGSMMPVSTIIAAAGSTFSGVIYNTKGTYEMMFVIVIIASILATAAILLAMPPKKKTNAEGSILNVVDTQQ
jgi:MFS family permease